MCSLRFYGVSITCFGFSIFPWYSSASLWFIYTYIKMIYGRPHRQCGRDPVFMWNENGNKQSNFMRRHPKSFRYHYHYGYFINERNVKIWFRCQCCACLLHCVAVCVCQWNVWMLSTKCLNILLFPSFCAHFIHAQTKRNFHSENIVYHFSWALYRCSFLENGEQQSEEAKKRKHTARGEMRLWWGWDEINRWNHQSCARFSHVSFCLSHFVFYGYVVIQSFFFLK